MNHPFGWAESLMHEMRAAGSAWADRHGPFARAAYEFLVFGIKQAWACLFGGLMCALLIATFLFYPDDAALARYDFLVLAALAIQAAMLVFKLETWDEAKVILIYHAVGTAMEIFKVHAGSWVYPEESILRIGGVPLFSGFMYAAVGSYIARAWRLFDFEFSHYPPAPWTWALAVLVYVNFFAHHYWFDMRWVLFAATLAIFGRSWVHFRIDAEHRSMPLVVGFVLVALFIWLAENIGTFTRAWAYPGQEDGWEMVSLAKLGSWYLLMIISFVLVTLVSPPQPYRGPASARQAMSLR